MPVRKQSNHSPVDSPVDHSPVTRSHRASDCADGEVFPSGNRNAASHRWADFILDCASELDSTTIVSLFTGFCPVSGSITGGGDSQRHIYSSSGWSALPVVSSSLPAAGGALYHCCPPCICDAVDFLGTDTKTVVDSSGIGTEYTFVVIGNPCESAPPLMTDGRLDVPMTDPFSGENTTLGATAPDVVCDGASLERATLSDHGGVIIGMLQQADVGGGQSAVEAKEFCEERETAGYNSGMGVHCASLECTPWVRAAPPPPLPSLHHRSAPSRPAPVAGHLSSSGGAQPTEHVGFPPTTGNCGKQQCQIRLRRVGPLQTSSKS